jgi:catechol 2,3-dioxygenase-like lactoylglutathione lyase family enzyme
MKVNDEATARLLDVADLVLDLVYLQRDGVRIELLSYEEPGTEGEDNPRKMNKLGFTHLSFRADDPDELAAAIVAHGGRLLDERTVAFAGGNRGLMLTDPDGNLIELIERLVN